MRTTTIKFSGGGQNRCDEDRGRISGSCSGNESISSGVMGHCFMMTFSVYFSMRASLVAVEILNNRDVLPYLMSFSSLLIFNAYNQHTVQGF